MGNTFVARCLARGGGHPSANLQKVASNVLWLLEEDDGHGEGDGLGRRLGEGV